MKEEIVKELLAITPEEERLQQGSSIDRSLYMQGEGNTVNSKKLLEQGKVITMRKHTRFIEFPEHTHDYVELMYMCKGQTTHEIDGVSLTLKEGELLFLGQGTRHRIARAHANDIGVNFIILPHFFADILPEISKEESPLKSFLIQCLCGSQNAGGYLHYKVSHVTQIQNLMENLLLIVTGEEGNKRKQSQMTVALLLMQLLSHTRSLTGRTKEEEAVFKVLDYIETHYADGSLQEAASLFHYDSSWLSRELTRKTGKSYTALVQEKRLAQATFLLTNTKQSVADISVAVGYENISYFHRLFEKTFHMSPRTYRISHGA